MIMIKSTIKSMNPKTNNFELVEIQLLNPASGGSKKGEIT